MRSVFRYRRPGDPHVVVVDGSADSLDEVELRERARALIPSDAPFSSRSYRLPFALVAFHASAVGVDIERVGACPPSMFSSICCPEEQAASAEGATLDLDDLWAGKEAAAKAMGNPVHYDPRLVLSPVLWPEGRAGRWRARRVAVPTSHVGWVCWQV